MSKSPYFPFYPSDWLAGVAGLTPAEVGVYINVLALIYENDGPVPFDSKRLSRRMGITAGPLKKIIDALIDQKKLIEQDGTLTNFRAEKEIQERSSKSAIAKNNAASRWKKSKQKQQTINTDASNPQCGNDANQNQNQNQLKEDASHLAKKPRRKSQTKIPDLWASAPNAILSEKNRKPALKAGMTAEDASREATKFVNFHTSKDNRYADWDAAWRTWCGNWRGRTAPRSQYPGGNNGGNVSLADVAARREMQRRVASGEPAGGCDGQGGQEPELFGGGGGGATIIDASAYLDNRTMAR